MPRQSRPATRRALVGVLPFLVAFGATMASAGLASALGAPEQRYTGRVCASCASFEITAAEEGSEIAEMDALPEQHHLSAESMVLAELGGPTPITREAKDTQAPSQKKKAAPPAAPALACQCDFIPLSSEQAKAPSAPPPPPKQPVKAPSAAADKKKAPAAKGFRERAEEDDRAEMDAKPAHERLMAYDPADAADAAEDRAADRAEDRAEDKLEHQYEG